MSVEQPQERKVLWSPRIDPMVVERFAPIARKKGISIERLANLYLQLMISWDELTAKELCVSMLEDVLTRCIEHPAIDP
jgi:hypothetical protein